MEYSEAIRMVMDGMHIARSAWVGTKYVRLVDAPGEQRVELYSVTHQQVVAWFGPEWEHDVKMIDWEVVL